MERALKQRLAGAAVLVILGAVFIPVLLDGAGHHARFAKDIEIPPPPKIEIRQWQDLKEIAAKPVTEAVTVSEPVAVSKSESRPVKEDEPVKTTTKPTISAWALQIGSFGQQTNALVMRDQLRAKGYQAYVETVKKASNINYKVRVGPNLDRSKLEKIQIKLKNEEKIDSIVVSHP